MKKGIKITQVTPEYVKEHLDDKNIYRILICDDGNYGHSHAVARMKPLKNLTLEEFTESLKDGQYGFIVIEEV